MGSSSGPISSDCSGTLPRSSSSEEDLQQQTLMEQRKRKRMLSNRESARRSRMRKQKHLDDLMALLGQLRKENSDILTSVNLTTQLYLNVETENSVLRAQLAELSHRLDSLNEIIGYVNFTTCGINNLEASQELQSGGVDDWFGNTWGPNFNGNQHVMDMVMY